MIEDLMYSRRVSKQTAQESATWSDNGSIVDRRKSAFVERQRDYVARRFWC